MKKFFRTYNLISILCLPILLLSCAQIVTNSTPPSHPEIATPFSESTGTLGLKMPISTPTYSTAPTDTELDQTCRITITYFFNVDKNFDIKAVRNLFVPSRQYFADSIIQRQTPLLVLEVLPASEWWQQNHPNESIPLYMQPKTKNQYVYYAKYTGIYAPNTTQIAPYPDSMLITVESQGARDCKIENYGWG